MKFLVTALALVLGAPEVAVQAAGAGDEVVVVYNSRMPVSKGVAEYYAEQRQVPKSQIFGYSLPSSEEISRAEFRDSLQKPLAKALLGKKLWRIVPRLTSTGNGKTAMEPAVSESKIRYLVLCYGVPLKILEDPKLQDVPIEPQLRPELRRNEACVDSELALLPLFEQKLPLAGPLRNPVYAVTNMAAVDPTNGVLMVARLDGPSPEIARGLVDKALLAEAEGLWGRAYIDLRNTSDPGLKLGDDSLRMAGEVCRQLGFETTVDNSPQTFTDGFPMSHIAVYMGWYTENVDGPFAQPEVEFMPGAFAYHLHSFSASTIRFADHNWVGPFLAKGVTATMGCVYEPYLTFTPDMSVFAARFLYAGFSFGEAAYASQTVLSWQTTVVGDPLYRPGREPLQAYEARLKQKNSPLLVWPPLRIVDIGLASGKTPAEAVGYLEELALTKHSALLTEKLGDLYAQLGKPSSSAHSYAEALKLDPSPEQRVRLRLTLGEKLLALKQDTDAFENYQALLKECPAYPDKLVVCRTLLQLAQKLDKPDEAKHYETLLNGGAPATKP